MNKMVIYKDLGKFKVTTEENYNRAVRNAKEITDCSDFESAQAIVDYFVEYFYKTEDDFIIIE